LEYKGYSRLKLIDLPFTLAVSGMPDWRWSAGELAQAFRRAIGDNK
jgi:hypothetical protein